jgi:hypothetical protein
MRLPFKILLGIIVTLAAVGAFGYFTHSGGYAQAQNTRGSSTPKDVAYPSPQKFAQRWNSLIDDQVLAITKGSKVVENSTTPGPTVPVNNLGNDSSEMEVGELDLTDAEILYTAKDQSYMFMATQGTPNSGGLALGTMCLNLLRSASPGLTDSEANLVFEHAKAMYKAATLPRGVSTYKGIQMELWDSSAGSACRVMPSTS